MGALWSQATSSFSFSDREDTIHFEEYLTLHQRPLIVAQYAFTPFSFLKEGHVLSDDAQEVRTQGHTTRRARMDETKDDAVRVTRFSVSFMHGSIGQAHLDRRRWHRLTTRP